ncbi:hypothetical protein FB451DRAFT_1308367, partial [Mycena latifolia]
QPSATSCSQRLSIISRSNLWFLSIGSYLLGFRLLDLWFLVSSHYRLATVSAPCTSSSVLLLVCRTTLFWVVIGYSSVAKLFPMHLLSSPRALFSRGSRGQVYFHQLEWILHAKPLLQVSWPHRTQMALPWTSMIKPLCATLSKPRHRPLDVVVLAMSHCLHAIPHACLPL